MLCNNVFPKDSDRLHLSYTYLPCSIVLEECLRLLNKECDECLFNQAKNITRTTTNMHPEPESNIVKS